MPAPAMTQEYTLSPHPLFPGGVYFCHFPRRVLGVPGGGRTVRLRLDTADSADGGFQDEAVTPSDRLGPLSDASAPTGWLASPA